MSHTKHAYTETHLGKVELKGGDNGGSVGKSGHSQTTGAREETRARRAMTLRA